MTTTRLDHIAERQHRSRVRDTLFALVAALVLIVQLVGIGVAGGIPLAEPEPAAVPPTLIEVIEDRDRARYFADTAPCEPADGTLATAPTRAAAPAAPAC